MKKFDLVHNGKLVKENVRYNVRACCDGPSVTHGDVMSLSAHECQCHGIYERLETIPKYDGRFQRLGACSSVIDATDFTVTHSTVIEELDITTCKLSLLEYIESRYATSLEVNDPSYDLETIRTNHINSITDLTNRSEVVAYDVQTGWPSEPTL